MKIEINDEGTAWQTIIISEIQGDMGAEQGYLSLLQQPDGDVIIGITQPGKRDVSVEFCTSTGGGRFPVIAKKLRELIAELVKGA